LVGQEEITEVREEPPQGGFHRKNHIRISPEKESPRGAIVIITFENSAEKFSLMQRGVSRLVSGLWGDGRVKPGGWERVFRESDIGTR